jgi:hypothetical protein
VSRRGFLKNFGLLGVVVAGASAALANNQPIVVPAPTPAPTQPKDFAHLAPSDDVSGILSLYSDNRSREEKETEYNNSQTHGVIFVTNDFKSTNKVHMTVGKDNRLWIKFDDEWKRVALDT